MAITAQKIIKYFEDLELSFKDKGVDGDGDHIILTGFGVSDYEDFDGKNSIMCQIQLLEHKEGTGEQGNEIKTLKGLLAELDFDKDEDVLRAKELQKKIKEMKDAGESGSMREYEMIAAYIPRLNAKGLTRQETLEIINKINHKLKGARMAIDSHKDIIFYYQIPLEDGDFTSNQFQRLLSIMHSAVKEFGKAVNSN